MRASPLTAGVGALLLVLATAGAAAAQWDASARPALPSPGGAAGRSLVLPGWGQHALGQRRSLAYGVAEAALWVFWGNRRSQGGDLRDAYRDLAWSVARHGSGARTDGDWDYYETLSRWRSSGAFDRNAGAAGIQPEEDATTFNGSVWRLAEGLHFGGTTPEPGDPRYEAALAFYRDRAYGDAFLWDWTGKDADLDRFKDLIDDSDQRFRQATTGLGAVLANHLLSATDAYLSAQLPGDAGVRLSPQAPGTTPGLMLTLTWVPPP